MNVLSSGFPHAPPKPRSIHPFSIGTPSLAFNVIDGPQLLFG
jgi:hypothetical protein